MGGAPMVGTGVVVTGNGVGAMSCCVLDTVVNVATMFAVAVGGVVGIAVTVRAAVVVVVTVSTGTDGVFGPAQALNRIKATLKIFNKKRLV